MNVTICTVKDCTNERVGLTMCARHLFAWALGRHLEHDAA